MSFRFSLDIFADDLTLQVACQLKALQQLSVETIKMLCDTLQDLGLPVAKSKALLTASDGVPSQRIAHRLRGYGFQAQSWLEVLGLEVATGKPAQSSVLRRRVRKVAKRGRHFRRLANLGLKFRKVARAAIGPAITYGLGILGAAPHVIAKMTSLVKHGWASIPRGGSHWIASQLDVNPASHPACVAVVGPIHNWACMAHAGEVPHHVMQRAWQTQFLKVTAAGRRNWSQVIGPAGALARSMQHLGWIGSSAFAVRTRSGEILDLRDTSPSVVKWLALQDYEAVEWANWAQRDDVMPEVPGPSHKDPAGVWLAPLRALLTAGAKAKKWVLDPLARAALRTAAIGGHFSQQRLYQYACASSPDCQRCAGVPGTCHHRYWCCPTLDEYREQAVDDATLLAAAAAPPGDLLYTRALYPNSSLPALPARDDSGAWHYDRGARAEQLVVTGQVFTDGSCRKLLCWDIAARAGWGFVLVGDSSYRGAVFGPLPGPRQTSARAELHAILQVLVAGVAPLHIYTDYLPFIDGLARGNKWCTAAARDNVDIWKRLWHYIEEHGGTEAAGDRGPAPLTFTHVRGHQKEDTWERRCNDLADQAATRGRRLHDLPCRVVQHHGRALDRVRQTAAWIASASKLQWTGAVAADRVEVARRRPAELRRRWREQRGRPAAEAPPPAAAEGAGTDGPCAPPAAPAFPHALRLLVRGKRNRWQCERCPAFAASMAGARKLKCLTCPVAEAAALWGQGFSSRDVAGAGPDDGPTAPGGASTPSPSAGDGPPVAEVGGSQEPGPDAEPPPSVLEGPERLLAFKRVRFRSEAEQRDLDLADVCWPSAKAARVHDSAEPKCPPSPPSKTRARSEGESRVDGSGASGGPRLKAPRVGAPAAPPRLAKRPGSPRGDPPAKRDKASGGQRQGESWVARDAVPPDFPLPAHGPVGPASARGHAIVLAGSTLAFCRRCGARAQPSAPRPRLWGVCSGRASSNDTTYLRALEAGKDPISGEWRGEPRPLQSSDDACFWLRLR